MCYSCHLRQFVFSFLFSSAAIYVGEINHHLAGFTSRDTCNASITCQRNFHFDVASKRRRGIERRERGGNELGECLELLMSEMKANHNWKDPCQIHCDSKAEVRRFPLNSRLRFPNSRTAETQSRLERRTRASWAPPNAGIMCESF